MLIWTKSSVGKEADQLANWPTGETGETGGK